MKKKNMVFIFQNGKFWSYSQSTSYFRAGNCLPDAYVVVILCFCDGVGDITVYCQFLTLFIFELTFLFWKIATSMLCYKNMIVLVFMSKHYPWILSKSKDFFASTYTTVTAACPIIEKKFLMPPNNNNRISNEYKKCLSLLFFHMNNRRISVFLFKYLI